MSDLEQRIEMAGNIGLNVTLKLKDGVTAFTVDGMGCNMNPRLVHSIYCVFEPTPEALRALAEACDRFADRMTWAAPKEGSVCRGCSAIVPKGEPFCSDQCEHEYSLGAEDEDGGVGRV